MNQVGRYQILEELGRGACGVVYRALDPAIGRTVAIKAIRFSEFSDPAERRELRERVLREAQSAGKLSHPNIVTIYDVLESSDLAYIFMELVDGPSLKDAMRREAIPTREQALSFIRQIGLALDYAHRKGIVHRDIKPANIMISDRGVDREGVAKIADFGVAKLVSHESTQQRALMGTPSYMSPEQLEGVAVGGASDQFALAVVVYELLTGIKPFVAENLVALHYFICKRPAKPVHEVNSTLSETVNRVMEHAMAKLPEERFATCSEFVGALSVALGECPDWKPVAPKDDEAEKAAGNGWYAPETVISARLADGEASAGEQAIAVRPVVMPPEPEALAPEGFEKALSTRVVPESEREAYAAGGARDLGTRTSGTKVRVGVERPAARRWGATMAACAALAILGILLLRFLSGPREAAADFQGKSSRIVTIPPEDLSAANRQAGAAPLDLTTVAQPIGADSNPSSTTVAVRAPAMPEKQAARAAQAAPEVKAPPVVATRPVVETRAVAPAAAAVSEVEIVSDPPGSRVEVDGREDFSCLAPCTLPLTAGRHTLSAELGGYGIARKIFSVPVSGSVFVSMTRNTGMFVLTSEPAGTMVAIDGQDLGPTPIKVKLPAGRHHLSLSDGRRHHDETIVIDTDGMYARMFRW